nr:terminase gpA endonuclease subunit [Cereibacter ovatus]
MRRGGSLHLGCQASGAGLTAAARSIRRAATPLTAGVDVQGDRIEVQIVGWGRDEEAWVIDYRVLWGDPSGPRLWSDLDVVLNGTWGDLPVRAVAVDTGGHHTKMAYEFCRTRLARRVWAIKGRGGPGIPVWPRRPTRSNKAKIPLFIVGVDAVKDAVYARLKLTEPGPGAIHFPRRLDADYFRQLTAERVVTRFERGRPIRSWQPKRDGERNEALDTFVYAHAALHGLISMGMRLNTEAAGPVSPPVTHGAPPTRAIRSAWMG